VRLSALTRRSIVIVTGVNVGAFWADPRAPKEIVIKSSPV
jgi:hypothetical protein